jgi:hypothetical protein
MALDFFRDCLKGLFIAMLAFPVLVLYASALAQAITLGVTRGLNVANQVK